MKIDKELEIKFIKALQKQSNIRTKLEKKSIAYRCNYINSQFKWSMELDEKLVLLNNKLREEEKKVFKQFRKIESQCIVMVENSEIKDFNIQLESEYWNKSKYLEQYPEISDEPFYTNTWDSFMMFQHSQDEYDNYCYNTMSQMFFIPKDSKIAKANHCHSFHHLYDHTDLTWFDIYNINELWIEIKVDYQFFSVVI